MLRWTAEIRGRGACHHPDGAARFVESALGVFEDELESHRHRTLPLPAAGLPLGATAGSRSASRTVGAAPMSARLRVNPITCEAHGLCAELLPELIRLDDWGYPILDSADVPPELLELARRAADACPTLALILDETPALSRPAGSGMPECRGLVASGPAYWGSHDHLRALRHESPSGFRFCGACGGPLPAEPSVRRDPEDRDRAVLRHRRLDRARRAARSRGPAQTSSTATSTSIRETIERHGGTVQKFAGDAVLAVFGIPQVHEDDALRAVRAAVEIHAADSLAPSRSGVELRFRTGINTGLVLTDEGRSLALGDAVNVAARLEQAAPPGEILLGADTLRLVRDAVEVERSRAAQRQGQVRARPRLPAAAPSIRSRRGVARRFDVVARRPRARARPAPQRPGSGSIASVGLPPDHPARAGRAWASRGWPRRAAGRGRERATSCSGRCLPYGEGITFWPLDRGAGAGGSARRPSRCATVTLPGGVATPEELFLEVRRLLESLARRARDPPHRRPPVGRADAARAARARRRPRAGPPILVLCTARPELLEEHATWAGASDNATTLRARAAAQRRVRAAARSSIGDGLGARRGRA